MTVAGGIDTSSEQADVAVTLNSLFSAQYLRDLRRRTLRGLEGRALAGYATGGSAYGFRNHPELGADGKRIGSRVEIEPEQAKVVVRVFTLYRDGYSFAAIAKRLNDDRIPPPRVNAPNRRRGWKDTTIRSFLHNESYTGRWTYKAKEWRKPPGTNKRRYRARDESEVIRQTFSERRIIDEELWAAVQERLAAVSRHYTRTRDGKPKGRSLPQRRSTYLFSSLLFCGQCGGKMVICGGSGANAYYRCEVFPIAGMRGGVTS